MQELKMQNGLLLQLVKGLQNQINSKNRENHILFQQYEQLASDNSAIRSKIEALKSKNKGQNSETQINSPRQQENAHLKHKVALLQEKIRGLVIQVDQKQGSIIFMQSQLQEAKSQLLSYEQLHNNNSKTQIKITDQLKNVDAQILNQLNRKIESFESQIQERQVLLDSLKKQKEELKQKIVSLENLQQKNKQKKDSLMIQINQQKLILASKEQSEDTFFILNQRVKLLEQALMIKEQQVIVLNNNNNQKQARIKELQIKFSQANTIPPQKIKQLQEILAKEGSLIVNLTQKVQQLEARELELQRQLEVVQRKYRAIDIEIEKQEQNNVNVSINHNVNVSKNQKKSSSVNIQEIQRLNQSIIQLQTIINSKSETISQLSQFMNEQAARVSELQAQVQKNQLNSVTNKMDKEKIDELEALIKMKEQSLAQLREYLEQNAAKNIQLQKKVIQLQTESRKAQELQRNSIKQNKQMQVVGYLADLKVYQAKNKKLRTQIDNISSQKAIYENNINALNLQIKHLNQQINQKNQLIESLHHLDGQKEKRFNEKIEEIKNSFQITGNQFRLNLNKKQSKDKESTYQLDEEKYHILKKENALLQLLVKELKEELQILLAENKNKSAQIKSLKEAYKQPAMEKEFVDLLRDSSSNINEEEIDQHTMIDRLKYEKDALIQKCEVLELKIKEVQADQQKYLQYIEILQKQLNQHQSSKVRESEQSQAKNKVLSQLYVKKQEQRIQNEMSEEKEHALIQKIMQKNEIIGDLQETVLKLQKGYNYQIMELRKNNAELNSQIINLTKKVYLLDPNSIDIADFAKQTCRQAISETQFYKSRYNLKYVSKYIQVEQPHNNSYLTQHPRSKRYDPFFNHKEATLGEKILGRRCRADPLNYTMNNDYRSNASVRQMQGTRLL